MTLNVTTNPATFAGMYASHVDDKPVVKRVFQHEDGSFSVDTEPITAGKAMSIVSDHPAAIWDERELRDLHGITFVGHEPHRPLIDHDTPLAAWTTPVSGTDVYDIAVGPIHAGIIESGHFRFHVVGETVLHLDLRMFYKRRGIEQLAQGATHADALKLVGRACAACHVANTVAFAQACEATLGFEPTADMARARTLLLELERVWNLCNDIAAICAGVGYAIGNMAFASLKERTQWICYNLTGHRFLFDTIQIGGTALAIQPPDQVTARAQLKQIRTDARAAWRDILHAPSVHDRCNNIGTLDRSTAVTLGALGPVARASGVIVDARSHSPQLHYPGFTPAALTNPSGDVAARLEIRALEIDASLEVLDQLLSVEISPSTSNDAPTSRQPGIGYVESPRGANCCIVEHDGDRVTNLKLRTSSYANWPVLATVVPGNLLPDFPLINKSFELCYACCDR